MTDEPTTDLTQKLRDAAHDPPPESLLAAARAAYSWRTPEGQLVAASYDSLLEEGLTSVRSIGGTRLLSFGDERLALDVEVATAGATRSLLGQVTPPTPAEVTIRHGGAEEATVTTDSVGRFEIGELRPGPLSIRCTLPDTQESLHTDWVLV